MSRVDTIGTGRIVGTDQVDYRRRGGRVGEGKVTKASYQELVNVVRGLIPVTTKASNILAEIDPVEYSVSPSWQAMIDRGEQHPDDKRLSDRAIGVIANTLLRAGGQPTKESVQQAIGSLRSVKLVLFQP